MVFSRRFITYLSLRKYSQKSDTPALETGTRSEAALDEQIQQALSKIEPHSPARIETAAEAFRIVSAAEDKEAPAPSTAIARGDELAEIAADIEASLREQQIPFLSAQALPFVSGSISEAQPSRRLGE